MSNYTIALVGNPNCGKTTLFNTLTGANQRVGNWPGVTVDRKEGTYRYGEKNVTVVDLPGIYAIDADVDGSSVDEAIARDYLISDQAQVVVNIVDASNLERNLYLTTQILEMGVPLVVALNMMDVAEDNGIRIDPEKLAQRLGCPVVALVASRGRGVDGLRDRLNQVLESPKVATARVVYPSLIEEALAVLIPELEAATSTEEGSQAIHPSRHRWSALKLLEYDDASTPNLPPTVLQHVAEQRHRIHQVLGEDIDIAIADSRYSHAHRLVSEVAVRPRQVNVTRSDKIDRIVLNRWLGIPIFLGVMYLLFMFAINVGSAFIDFFDIVFGTVFVDGLGHLLAAIGMPDIVQVVLATGFGGGIQTVATFIPVIACLFYGIFGRQWLHGPCRLCNGSVYALRGPTR